MNSESALELTTHELSLLIVEDDLSFAIELNMLVRNIGYQVKARVDNSAEALEIALVDPPDLILMDIDIKGRLNGLEVAEQLKDHPIPILFITSYTDQKTYERAQKTNFIGYLVKPINKFSLRTSIDLAMNSLKTSNTSTLKDGAFSNNEFLFFKKKGVFQKVNISEISYVQANDDYSISYTKDSKFLSSLRLKELEQLLADHGFFRIHRSFLLNLTAATSVDMENNQISIHGRSIPFSRRVKTELIKRLSLV